MNCTMTRVTLSLEPSLRARSHRSSAASDALFESSNAALGNAMELHRIEGDRGKGGYKRGIGDAERVTDDEIRVTDRY